MMLDLDFDIIVNLEAFNSGSFIREGDDYIVGNRRYGYHLDMRILYPKSGSGMVDIDRSQHQFLKKLNSGSYEDVMKFTKNTPGLDQKKIDQILKVRRRCK